MKVDVENWDKMEELQEGRMKEGNEERPDSYAFLQGWTRICKRPRCQCL